MDDEYYELTGQDVLNKWFSSEQWNHICETDEECCVELMERVSDHLGSLIFHIQHNSGESRIQYELKFFTDLCKEFVVPLY
jgi:hypothetical protein